MGFLLLFVEFQPQTQSQLCRVALESTKLWKNVCFWHWNLDLYWTPWWAREIQTDFNDILLWNPLSMCYELLCPNMYQSILCKYMLVNLSKVQNINVNTISYICVCSFVLCYKLLALVHRFVGNRAKCKEKGLCC